MNDFDESHIDAILQNVIYDYKARKNKKNIRTHTVRIHESKFSDWYLKDNDVENSQGCDEDADRS